VAEVAAAKLVEHSAADIVVGGIYSSTRQAIKRPMVDQAETPTSIRSSTKAKSVTR
jgi:hypothetical protein